jgi:CRP-like cAMP-binding protein
MLTSDVSSLQRIAMFRDVDAAKLKLIAMASQRTTYRIGDKLFSEGASSDAVFIILDGRATVMRSDGNGDVVVARVEEGALVGEIGLVLDKPYLGTVVAETSVIALRIDKRTFFDLLHQVPQFSMALIRELAGRLLDTSDLYVKALAR